MLGESGVQATLPAADLERARQWYQEKLGLTPAEETSAGIRYEAGSGTGFLVYPTPNPNRGGHTQMAFRVPALGAEMTALGSAGVAFEEYDLPGFKTTDGVGKSTAYASLSSRTARAISSGSRGTPEPAGVAQPGPWFRTPAFRRPDCRRAAGTCLIYDQHAYY